MMELDGFRSWKAAGRIQFGKLGKGREMYSLQTLGQMTGKSARFDYQYRQIHSLILDRMGFSNVFRPLTSFEQVIVLGNFLKGTN